MNLDLQVIRQQLQSCTAQRDQAAQTFQQCVGAIAVLEEQLKVILAEEMKKKENPEVKDDKDCGCKGEANGEVEQQEQVEAPQE